METLVDFELAKDLKDHGFPQEDFLDTTVYPINTVTWENHYEGNPYSYNPGDVINLMEESACGSYEVGGFTEDNYIAAPSLSEVRDWLEKTWSIHVCPELEIECDSYGNTIGYHYDCRVTDINLAEQEYTEIRLEGFKSYQEAFMAGLKKSLDWI